MALREGDLHHFQKCFLLHVQCCRETFLLIGSIFEVFCEMNRAFSKSVWYLAEVLNDGKSEFCGEMSLLYLISVLMKKNFSEFSGLLFLLKCTNPVTEVLDQDTRAWCLREVELELSEQRMVCPGHGYWKLHIKYKPARQIKLFNGVLPCCSCPEHCARVNSLGYP